jgi:ribosome-associated protein
MIAVSESYNEQVLIMQNTHPNNFKQDTTISKTRVKQEMHALQKIGERLIELNPNQLKEFFLPDTLFEAIIEAKQIHKNGARRRQIQYIGRLMREVDISPIKKKLSAWDGISKQHTAWIHQIERWRDSLLKDKSSFAEFARLYPDDLQRIRTLTRNTHKEMLSGKPLKSFRNLFHELQINIPKTTEQNDEVIK